MLSHSDSSLLVYRKAGDLCILILYPATLPNSCISSNSFGVETSGFSIYSIMLLANHDSFLSFQFGFISFSCLIAMARTSNTILNRSGESGHPYLVPELRGKAFSFSPLSMILAVGLS